MSFRASETNRASKKPKISEHVLKNATVRTSEDPNWRMDWPAKTGDIDLHIHDLPHDSSETEWWYFNTHLHTKAVDGNTPGEFSLFCCFFRNIRDFDATTSVGKFAHSFVMALVDKTNKKYYPVSLVDPDACLLMRERLAKHEKADKRLRAALMEMLERDSLPLPDRAMDFQEEDWIKYDCLSLNFNGNTLVKSGNNYHLKVCTAKVSFELEFNPLVSVQRQGDVGVTHVGRHGEEMFYYFIPSNAVTGTIYHENVAFEVSGDGWYDHEFGGTIKEKAIHDPNSETLLGGKHVEEEFGWDWSSLQLNNGVQITSTHLWQQKDLSTHEKYAVIVDNGARTVRRDMNWSNVGNQWTSVRTYQKFYLQHRLEIPGLLDISLKPCFEDQEFITFLSDPSFYEGRVEISGFYKGNPVSGKGFIELHGHASTRKMDQFLKSVSEQVALQVEEIIPRDCSHEKLQEMIGGPEFDHYMDGLDTETFRKSIINPVRDIIDRGGKAWRSYACLLCVDCVGGDSRPFMVMLAMPELMHVGSLIIDDIQDRSDTRRGGPSCHKIYGEPIAINAGTACYFLSEYGIRQICRDEPLKKIRLYEIYFQALRAGHVGQAADIAGLDHLMERVVKEGGGIDLLRTVCATHRLKSAAPAGGLARMGTIMGGGTETQISKMGLFFEALGVAFQIMDDVLNIRGMRSGKKALKVLGEDLSEGKITYPVAKAMCLLDEKGRSDFWNRLKNKPQNPDEVASLTEILEKCGALDGSCDDASQMVDDAWEALSPVLEDSFYKAMLRAFSFFVLDRHY